jgi:hypothetical protein
MPLLRLPEVLPKPVVAIVAMVVLAGLDIVGALLARRWAHGGGLLWFGVGVTCFIVLFWVYGSSLRYADLIPVTFGWIAALQVGLMIVGRVGSSTAVPAKQWLAAAVIIVLEGYLLLSSEGA